MKCMKRAFDTFAPVHDLAVSSFRGGRHFFLVSTKERR
jgi:hypothetical protein